MSSETRDPLTHRLIGFAMEVHRELGPGLDERFYHHLLAAKLCGAGVEYQFRPRRELVYHGMAADLFEPDIVVADLVVLELKTLRGTFAPEHFSQILSYQKAWKAPTGLLFDFAKASLMFRRLIRTEPEVLLPPLPDLPIAAPDAQLARALYDVITEVVLDHGVGYRPTTYRGLLGAALKGKGIEHCDEPQVDVLNLGRTQLHCLAVAQRCAIGISALGEGLTATDRAILQTYLHWLGFSWGIAVHFGKRAVDLQFVRSPRRRDACDGIPSN